MGRGTMGGTGARYPLTFVKKQENLPFFHWECALFDAIIYTCGHVKYIYYFLKLYKN